MLHFVACEINIDEQYNIDEMKGLVLLKKAVQMPFFLI